MGSEREEADGGTSSTVPIDAIPAPVVAYDVRDDEPVIVGANDRFEAAFDTVPTGISVARWLRDGVGVDAGRDDDVRSSLIHEDSVDIDLDVDAPDATALEPGRYRLRTFEESGDESGGHLLLVDGPAGDVDGVETDRIASVISHDLRNPLDVANAHLRAARETGETEHFDQIRQSHDRMEQIIQDVLTLARGKSALSIVADVDIEAVAADAWATVDTKDASLTLADDLPTTAADPDRLQRLFENLFRNSIEHAHPAAGGEPTGGKGDDGDADHPLRVRIGRTNGGFFVADNGTGVPREDRTRVFDPGYSSETGSGTGLGLTIVEEIAEAHGWTVSLTSGALGGARFEFRSLDRGDGKGNAGEQ